MTLPDRRPNHNVAPTRRGEAASLASAAAASRAALTMSPVSAWIDRTASSSAAPSNRDARLDRLPRAEHHRRRLPRVRRRNPRRDLDTFDERPCFFRAPAVSRVERRRRRRGFRRAAGCGEHHRLERRVRRERGDLLGRQRSSRRRPQSPPPRIPCPGARTRPRQRTPSASPQASPTSLSSPCRDRVRALPERRSRVPVEAFSASASGGAKTTGRLSRIGPLASMSA